MVKILVLLLGMAAGAAGAAAWLLERASAEPATGSPEGAATRLASSFQRALAEGKQARVATENRLRRELDVYRSRPDRPSPST